MGQEAGWKRPLERGNLQPACSGIRNSSMVHAPMTPTLSQTVGLVSQKPDLRGHSVGHFILREGTVEKENYEEDKFHP